MSKILLLSAQPVLVAGLSHVLERQGFEIANQDAPADVILLDATTGLELADLSSLQARMPDCPIVLWADALPLEDLFRTMEVGVRGIVQRTTRAEPLAETLRRVAAGEMQLGFGPASAPRRKKISLTPRERELLSRLRRGLRNKQIAAEMEISEGTVKIYLFRLFHKLGVRTRFELACCPAGDGSAG